MGHSDQAAAVGKLHMELDHCRSKEGLARAALNRSEAARVEVVRLARGLRQQLSRLTAQLAIQQDRARWGAAGLGGAVAAAWMTAPQAELGQYACPNAHGGSCKRRGWPVLRVVGGHRHTSCFRSPFHLPTLCHPDIPPCCLDCCRWSERELQDATTRMTLGLAGRTEPWKAAHWGRKLEQLKGRNDALAGAMEAALARAARLEDEGQAAALQQQLLRDVEGLLARGVSDAHREAAGLKDQVARLRLEGGKRGRGELLMRQKVGRAPGERVAGRGLHIVAVTHTGGVILGG